MFVDASCGTISRNSIEKGCATGYGGVVTITGESGVAPEPMCVAGHGVAISGGACHAELACLVNAMGLVRSFLENTLGMHEMNGTATALSITMDNLYVVNAAIGKNKRSGMAGKWKQFDRILGMFDSVAIRQRPRNSLWEMELSDKIAGKCREKRLASDADQVKPGSDIAGLMDFKDVKDFIADPWSFDFGVRNIGVGGRMNWITRKT